MPLSRRVAILGVAAASVLFAILLVRSGFHAERPVLAVLPFTNFTSDPADILFCDALADDIIRSLSTVSGLDVISRTSTFAFRDTRTDVREIGKRLGATVLLDGTVQKPEGRLRVTAELTRATDGKQLWSASYERASGDPYSIQQDIAASIASAMRLKLDRGQPQYDRNPEAYASYLRGRYALDSHKAPNALKHFEHAVAVDADYAPAHAGIADALLAMHHDLALTFADMEPRARAEAQKAVQLAPALSDGYTALGTVLARKYAWTDAEGQLRRAIDLNPNSSSAHLTLGDEVLVPLGRLDDGLAEIRRSLALDPLSQGSSQALVWTLIDAGRYTEAAEQARTTISLDPSRPEPYLLLARALYFQGKNDEALSVMFESDRRALRGRLAGWLACAYVRAGNRREAERLLQGTLENAFGEPLANRRMVQFYACLGQRDRVFEYLDKMYTTRESALPHFLRYPELAWLRSDQRYTEMMDRLRIGR